MHIAKVRKNACAFLPPHNVPFISIKYLIISLCQRHFSTLKIWKQIFSVYFLINVYTSIENIFTSTFSSICKIEEYGNVLKITHLDFAKVKYLPCSEMTSFCLVKLLKNYSCSGSHHTFFDVWKFLRNSVFTTFIITTSSTSHCSTTSNIYNSHVKHLCICYSASIYPVKHTYLQAK